jgi:predicted RND superfamily exporter protein
MIKHSLEGTFLTRFLRKTTEIQLKHPLVILTIAVLITIMAAFTVVGLVFDSSYEALFPVKSPELNELRYVRERAGNVRQFLIAVGGEKEDRETFGRLIAARLAGMEGIRFVDFEYPIEFFGKRMLWFAEIGDLEHLSSALNMAIKTPGASARNAWLGVERAWKKAQLEQPSEAVLTSGDDLYSFITVIPSIPFSDIEASRVLLGKIQKEVHALKATEQGIDIRYAGWLPVIQETHNVMKRSLKRATLLAFCIGVLIVAALTGRILAPLLIGISLAPGIIWSLALTRVFIGQVNIITGFCFAILIGLGIDFGVHLYTRFWQSSMTKGITPGQAVAAAVRGTSRPALVSALTTTGVFFTFTFSEFRGFSEFGLIAGMGTLCTLFSCFLILPPLLIVVYGQRGSGSGRDGNDKQIRTGKFVPTGLATGVVTLFFCLAVFGAFNISNIPFHNNLKKLRGISPVTEFTDYVVKNLNTGFNPAVFVVQNLQDASDLADLARKTREDDPSSRIRGVLSLTDFLPRDVAERQRNISSILSALKSIPSGNAMVLSSVKIQRLMWQLATMEKAPWGVDEVPEVFQRRFISHDEKEFLVYLWPEGDNDVDESAIAWETELRRFSHDLNDREIVHHYADETLLLAWIHRLVKNDGPFLLTVSLTLVLLILLIDTRHIGRAFLVFSPLAIGMLTLVSIARFNGLELNMYNMVVLPSLIGIGIDNAVHIYHRYRTEGRGTVPLVVKRAGFAAMLASATTAGGFGAIIISPNLGLKSFGKLAVLGITVLFLSTVLFFPSLLTLLERRHESAPKEADS